MTPQITVLYFARLREAVGVQEERIALAADVATVADLLAHLARTDPQKQAAFARLDVKVAVNQAQATGATPLAPGDEVALFPPVTGG